jgi:hypothetical protein
MLDLKRVVVVVALAAIIIFTSVPSGYGDSYLEARQVRLRYDQTRRLIAERGAKDQQEVQSTVEQAAKEIKESANPDEVFPTFIRWCGEYTDLNGIPSDASAAEIDLINLGGAVQEYTDWLEALARVGYPKDVWYAFLSNFERTQLTRIEAGRRFEGSKDFSRKLVDLLRNFETKNPGLKLPKLDWSHYCGDAGLTYRVYFRPSPSNGDIMIISAFFFELCRQRGDPPLDRSRCNYWRSTVPSKGDPVAAGQYYIYARWSDGIAIEPKLVDFREVEEGRVVEIDHP